MPKGQASCQFVLGLLTLLLASCQPPNTAPASSGSGTGPVQVEGSPDGLVAEWTFDSGTLTDSWGDHDLTAHGAPTSVAGRDGSNSAYRFRSGDYLSAPTSALGGFPNAFTISLWLRPLVTDTGGHSILMVGNGTDEVGRSLFHLQHTGSASFGLYYPPNVSGLSLGNPELAVNEWSHFAFSWDRTTGAYAFYSNDSLVSSGTFEETAESIDDLTELALGSRAHALDGDLDDVRLYDRVLTADEVSWLYNYPDPAPASVETALKGVVAEWLLDGGSGVDSRGILSLSKTGNPATVAGHDSTIDTALDFGSGDYLSVPLTNARFFPENLSLSFWLKPHAVDTGSHTIFRIGDGEEGEVSSSLVHLQHTGTGSLAIYFPPYEYSATVGNPGLEVDTWSHLVFTWDRSSKSYVLYANNTPVGSGTFEHQPTVGHLGELTWGSRPFNLNGALDDVRYYDRVLTAEDVAWLYQN